MRSNHHHSWDDGDFELEREFDDLTSILRENQSTPPAVPNRLDRMIRRHANFQVGGELRQSWLFAPAMQLTLAVMVMFGVGIMFVTSLEQERINGGQQPSVSNESRQADMKITKATLSWIKFRFTVEESGAISNVTVVDRCLNLSRSPRCSNDDQFDAAALKQLRSSQHKTPGEKEEIVTFLPRHDAKPD